MVNHDLAALHVRVFDALAYSSSGPRCVDSLARTKREPPAPTRFAPELIGTGRSAVGPSWSQEQFATSLAMWWPVISADSESIIPLSGLLSRLEEVDHGVPLIIEPSADLTLSLDDSTRSLAHAARRRSDAS